jgi:hypothetical protein
MMEARTEPSPVGIRVVYIVGFPRSGSTLLERMLGNEAGYFSAGELRRIWERGFIDNELCSCGRPFRSCDFWKRIISDAYGDPETVDAKYMAREIANLDDRRTRWREIAGRLRTPEKAASCQRDASLLALYRAIIAASDAPAIVDSSKDSSYALLLSTIPGLDVEIVHLVRDSRAVAYSWQRRRRRPEVVDRDEFMPIVRPAGSAWGWNARNSSAEALRWFASRYVRVRYEDIVEDPGRELARILKRPVHPNGTSEKAPPYHTVSGNPSRMTKGPLEVSLDREWMSDMSNRDRTLVTALTLPFLLRYGYDIDPSGAIAEVARP